MTLSPNCYLSTYHNRKGFRRIVLPPEMCLERFGFRRYDDNGDNYLYGLACVDADPLRLLVSSRLENVPAGRKSQSVTILDEHGGKHTGFTMYFGHGSWSGLRLEREASREGLPVIDTEGHPVGRDGIPRIYVMESSRPWRVGDHHGVNLRLDAKAHFERAPVQGGLW